MKFSLFFRLEKLMLDEVEYFSPVGENCVIGNVVAFLFMSLHMKHTLEYKIIVLYTCYRQNQNLRSLFLKLLKTTI